MLILASTSQTRQNMLQSAGVRFEAVAAIVDEEAIRDAMVAENEKPRDIADCLAEAKARKIASKLPGLVLGCDQICAKGDEIYTKPQSPEHLGVQLRALHGGNHELYSAAVIYKDGEPIWRHVGEARLTMRELSDDFIFRYATDHFDEVKNSAGGYQIEGIGAQLFTRTQGDYFSILGMPLLQILEFLRQHGELQR